MCCGINIGNDLKWFVYLKFCLLSCIKLVKFLLLVFDDNSYEFYFYKMIKLIKIIVV